MSTSPVMTNAVKVKKFIDNGSSKPTTIQEFNEFWKACGPEERNQFGAEVDALIPATA